MKHAMFKRWEFELNSPDPGKTSPDYRHRTVHAFREGITSYNLRLRRYDTLKKTFSPI